jgi:hypothetical protein
MGTTGMPQMTALDPSEAAQPDHSMFDLLALTGGDWTTFRHHSGATV